jgi:hypothetical protein
MGQKNLEDNGSSFRLEAGSRIRNSEQARQLNRFGGKTGQQGGNLSGAGCDRSGFGGPQSRALTGSSGGPFGGGGGEADKQRQQLAQHTVKEGDYSSIAATGQIKAKQLQLCRRTNKIFSMVIVRVPVPYVTFTVIPMGPVLALSLIRRKKCSFASIVS